MSEAILPCAACGGKYWEVDTARLLDCGISHDDDCPLCDTFPIYPEKWNQLQRWIADGRAVEQCEKEFPIGVNIGTYVGERVWRVGREVSHFAPTLAEAVRKAQCDDS